MKVWKEVDEVIGATIEVPEESWEAEETMRQIPNFNKTYERKVYQRKEYIIIKIKNNFII